MNVDVGSDGEYLNLNVSKGFIFAGINKLKDLSHAENDFGRNFWGHHLGCRRNGMQFRGSKNLG